MKIFRNLGDPPPVDMGRLTKNLARVAELDAELDRVVARLAIDMPGNADAVAAAGIHMRAQINRSSSMIELGAAAVDALRRGGWTLTSPAETVAPRRWVAPAGSGPEAQAAADVEDEVARLQAAREKGIPDDWAV